MTNFFGSFPEQAARKVVEWGNKVGRAEVGVLVEMIQTAFGDAPQLDAIAAVLNLQVANSLNRSEDHINGSMLRLKTYWEGGACEAAEAYSADLRAAAEANAKAAGDIAGKLLEFRKHLIEAYKTCCGYLTECEKNLLEAENSNMQAGLDLLNKANPFEVGKVYVGKIFQALQKFLTDTNAAIQKAADINQDISKTIQEIERTAASIRIPSPVQETVGDPGAWRVKPRRQQ